MKKIYLFLIIGTLIFWSTNIVKAGNPDRTGQAGATELLINPWAKSSGWNGAFQAGIYGIESMRFNPSGIIGIEGNSEFAFSRSTWLGGSDIFINSFGLVSKLGKEKTNAFGISVMSFDFGDIPITTFQQPDGGLGTYSPTFTNIGVSYAHKFSDRIRVGLLLRYITESIPDVSSQGVAFDVGLQYTTDISPKSDKKATHFGLSLRNVGTKMSFSGDGLDGRASFEDNNEVSLTVSSRSAAFELPVLLHIGAAQDFYFSDDLLKLTVALDFTGNSYSNDQIIAGLQLGIKDIFVIRGGYAYEKNIMSDEKRTVFTGVACGASVNIPISKAKKDEKRKMLSVDYSFRATDPFNGVHQFGARVNL